MNRSIIAITVLAIAIMIALGLSPTAWAQVNDGANTLSPAHSPASADDHSRNSNPTSSPDVRNSKMGQLTVLSHVGGKVDGVAIRDNFAYINDGGFFTIIDISDPVFPELVSISSPYPGRCTGPIVLQGDYAYVATGCGLRIFRISDPYAVAEVGFFVTPGALTDVAVDGNRAYLSDLIDGLFVLDISNPANPIEIGMHPVKTDERALIRSVAVSGNYVYTGGYDGLLHVFNVEVPSDMKMVATVSHNGEITDIGLKDNRLYVVGNGLQVLDITDPTNPVQLSRYSAMEQVYQLALDGNFAYMLTDAGRLDVIDLTDPSNPSLMGTYSRTQLSFDIAATDGYVFVAGGWYRDAPTLDIVDVRTPSSPVRVGTYNSPRAAVGLDIRGSYAYVADVHTGFRILDVSDPALPRQIASHSLPDGGRDVVVDDRYAYVLTGHSTVTILDISDPSRPGIVAEIGTRGGDYDIAKSGDFVYVAGGDYGLLIIDVSNPGRPVQAAHINRAIVSVKLDGKYAYALDTRGLRIYDISRPASPKQVGYIDLRGRLHEITVQNGYVYGATENGIQILNVAKPAKPVAVGLFMQFRYVSTVGTHDDMLYASGEGGMYALDLSNPERPVVAGRVDYFVNNGMSAQGETVYGLSMGGLSLIGWKSPGINIGEGVAGETTIGDSTTTIHERGGDIYGTADAFRFVFQVGAGDYDYISRITAWDPAGVSTAKAGIMLRESTDPDAPHITAHITGPAGALKLKWRSAAGGPTSNFNGPATSSLPLWLRITKSGSSVTAFFSGDGKTWTRLGSSQEIAALSDGFLYGMAVTSNSSTTQASATFTMVPRPSPVITSFFPTSGSVGSVVSIVGSDVGSATDVSINRLKADFDVVSPSRVDAVVPLGANIGKVTLTTSSGVSTSASDFTVTSPPEVMFFSPTSYVDYYAYDHSPSNIVSHPRGGFSSDRSVLYDGSAAGTPKDLESFSFIGDDIILGFSSAVLIPGIGKSSPQDLVRFSPTRLGYNNTAGTYSWYFDGSDVGLTTGSEAIDALWIDAVGRLYISTVGSGEVPVNSALPGGSKIRFQDEDVLRFEPSASSTGAATAGVWELYWDPSLMPGMLAADVNGYYEDEATGDRYITLLGRFTIGSDLYGKVTGTGQSIVRLAPSANAPGGWAPVESVNWANSYPGIIDELDAFELGH